MTKITIAKAEQWEIDEITGQIPLPTTSFRHLLAIDADTLLPNLCDAFNARIGILNRSPRRDTKGEAFIGPDRYGDPSWFQRMWEGSSNQLDARKSHKQDFESAYMIVPLDSAEKIVPEYERVRNLEEGLTPEECIKWFVSRRSHATWMIILLDSDRLCPLLLISESIDVVQAAAKTVCRIAPGALMSLWAGSETVSKE